MHSGSVQLYGRSALRHAALRGSHELYNLERLLVGHGWLLRLKEFNHFHHQRPVTVVYIRRYGRLSAGAEYQRAVLTYDLTYAELKEMARNSLEYSFLPGESYWRDHAYRSPASPCAPSITAKACQNFLKSSEKAAQQRDLEDRFHAFENSFASR